MPNAEIETEVAFLSRLESVALAFVAPVGGDAQRLRAQQPGQGCAQSHDPFLLAVCSNGEFQARNLHADPFTERAASDECQLAPRDCCACRVLGLAEVIAFNPARDSYSALVCDPAVDCTERGGKLYVTDATTGAWGATTAGVVHEGKLYSTETGGGLYVTHLKTGTWKAIGKPEFNDTEVIFAAKNSLLTIGVGGSLYAVEVK